MIIAIHVNFFAHVISLEVYLLKKGPVYTLIVCDSDEDKYTFPQLYLSDF